jgi:dTDP-4-dehydrorhamnose 3,5-epimerase
MKKSETAVFGAWIIDRDVYGDERGSFMETFSYPKLDALGIASTFVQGNESVSRRLTLRGLHYQLKRPQAKLCWVACGEVLDVIADIRIGSPTFGKVHLVHLTNRNKRAVYIPRGCAHGFLAISHGHTVFEYLCDDSYEPADQYGVIWNDPLLDIAWKTTAPLVSPKDAALRKMRDIPEKELPRFEP